MRILVLSPRQCWPTLSGAKLREFHLLRALGKSGDVELVHFSDRGASPLSRSELPFCEKVHSVSRPQTYAAGNLVRGLVGRLPLPVLNYTSQQMMETVVGLANSAEYDLVHLESIHMVRYAERLRALLPRARFFYNWHNIESEAMARYRENAASFARKCYAGITASKLRRLERQILQDAPGHVVCSERERQQLSDTVPRARVAVVENGVDSSYFAAAEKPNGPRCRLVFVGSMDYHPNIDGAVWFSEHVWPAMRRQLPEIELSIVGAKPTPLVQKLGKIPGISVTGTVPDVRPYYHGALAAVVPLRTGGGTRLKILEAMAAGVPVVSTALGAEGLHVAPEKDFLLGDTKGPESWVGHITTLRQDGQRREELVQAGLALVRNRYDWTILGERLVEIYREWLRSAP